jgi:hypothetical protein
MSFRDNRSKEDVAKAAKMRSEQIVAKLRRIAEGGEFRETELTTLAIQLGYLRREPQIDTCEWLASQLATAGHMRAAKSSVFDPDSEPLVFRDGSLVPQTPGPGYVVATVNALLSTAA